MRCVWCGSEKKNIPSSLRAYGHACPCCYGAIQWLFARMVRDYWEDDQSIVHSWEKNGRNIPRNLLDDISDKRSALAQVTLGSANLGLGDTSLGFLYHIINQPVHLLKNFAKKILQEVRRAGFLGFPWLGSFMNIRVLCWDRRRGRYELAFRRPL